jgi:glycosyltransferase involved in cell wall biosynthesis
MVTAIDDHAERARRGMNAHRHARENYSWRHVAEQMVGLYESHTRPCIGRQSGSPTRDSA